MTDTPSPTAADLRAAESLYEACAAKGRDAALAEIAQALAAARAAGAVCRDALEEILEYRGGADSALEDPYVMERARAALGATQALEPTRRVEPNAARRIADGFAQYLALLNVVLHEDEVRTLAGMIEAAPTSPAPAAGPGAGDEACETCHGTGEYFGHADDCRNEDCALAGGMGDCAGQVVECGHGPAPTGAPGGEG